MNRFEPSLGLWRGRPPVEIAPSTTHSAGCLASLMAADCIGLLRRIRRRRPQGPITMVLDNARYQRTAAVRSEADRLGVELLYLPPYSPNLNLIERVWKLVKKLALSARVLPDFEAFEASIINTSTVWKGLTSIK